MSPQAAKTPFWGSYSCHVTRSTHIRPSINKVFQPATDNDAILAVLLQPEQDNFSKLMVKNRLQQICSKQMVNKLSSVMIGVIDISIPPEDNMAISIDAHLALALQRLEEDEVNNLEEK